MLGQQDGVASIQAARGWRPHGMNIALGDELLGMSWLDRVAHNAQRARRRVCDFATGQSHLRGPLSSVEIWKLVEISSCELKPRSCNRVGTIIR